MLRVIKNRQHRKIFEFQEKERRIRQDKHDRILRSRQVGEQNIREYWKNRLTYYEAERESLKRRLQNVSQDLEANILRQLE